MSPFFYIPVLSGVIAAVVAYTVYGIRGGGLEALDKVLDDRKDEKAISNEPDNAKELIATFLAAGDLYFKNNAYAVITNLHAEWSITNLGSELTCTSPHACFDLMIITKHAIYLVDAVDFKGRLDIYSNSSYHEIIKATDSNGKGFPLRSNIVMPFTYREYVEEYASDGFLYLSDVGRSGYTWMYPIIHIVMTGRNVEIKDHVKEKSHLLQGTRGFENMDAKPEEIGSRIALSEQQALKMISIIDGKLAKKGGNLTRNQAVTFINEIQNREIYRERQLASPSFD